MELIKYYCPRCGRRLLNTQAFELDDIKEHKIVDMICHNCIESFSIVEDLITGKINIKSR